jgi:hypothetical protein
MTLLSRWRRQLRTEDEGAEFGLGAPNPARVGIQATTNIAEVSWQTIGGMAFEVVPDLLNGVEFRGIGWKRFQVQPRMSLAHRLNGQPPVNRAAVPQHDDVATEMPQQRAQEISDVDRLKVPRLPAEVQAQLLALRGHGQGGEGREPVMFVAIGDDGRVPLGGPGPATRGDQPKAALI